MLIMKGLGAPNVAIAEGCVLLLPFLLVIPSAASEPEKQRQSRSTNYSFIRPSNPLNAGSVRSGSSEGSTPAYTIDVE